MKKKHKRTRMTYEQRLRIDEEYPQNAICGYARNFHRTKDYINATCSLTNGRCKRLLPMEINKCGVYLDWLKVRQDIMRREGIEAQVEWK